MKYLIVECNELGDQWECDADRTPICLTDDYSKYNCHGYEIYEVREDGTFNLIREYGEFSSEKIVIAYWDEEEDENFTNPENFIEIKEGDRDVVTKSLIKKVKTTYGFKDTIKEIYTDISCCGAHGELINNKWVTFGEKFDNYFVKGY